MFITCPDWNKRYLVYAEYSRHSVTVGGVPLQVSHSQVCILFSGLSKSKLVIVCGLRFHDCILTYFLYSFFTVNFCKMATRLFTRVHSEQSAKFDELHTALDRRQIRFSTLRSSTTTTVSLPPSQFDLPTAAPLILRILGPSKYFGTVSHVRLLFFVFVALKHIHQGI